MWVTRHQNRLPGRRNHCICTLQQNTGFRSMHVIQHSEVHQCLQPGSPAFPKVQCRVRVGVSPAPRLPLIAQKCILRSPATMLVNNAFKTYKAACSVHKNPAAAPVQGCHPLALACATKDATGRQVSPRAMIAHDHLPCDLLAPGNTAASTNQYTCLRCTSELAAEGAATSLSEST
jgi:hypothetical protein